MKRRICSIALAIILAVTMLFANVTIGFSDKAMAAQAPDNIKMPIVMYDHLNDGLLFQYDLTNGMYLDLFTEIMEVTGQDAGKGLVATELSEEGTPVYKKEVVEKAAEYVKRYLESNDYTVWNNALLNQLADQMMESKTASKKNCKHKKFTGTGMECSRCSILN